MRIIHLLAVGAATLAVAVPAAAQTPYAYPYAQQANPQYQYPQQDYAQPGYGYAQPGYAYSGQPGYGGQNVIGQIVSQLLGNRYNVTDRTAVTQCATAAMHQASAQYRPRGYRQNYQQGYGYPDYNQGYNPAANMRVTSITNVERRNRGLRVSGEMSSGAHAGNHPYGNTYGYRNQVRGDLNFRCNVAYNGQVTGIRVRPNNSGYRR